MKTDRDILLVDNPLPFEMRLRLAALGGGTGGAVNVPQQTFTLLLADLTPSDIRAFRKPARLRVAKMKNFLLFSLAFSGFNFDMIWSSATAKATKEPGFTMERADAHPAFTFALVDPRFVVRALRVATLSPQVGVAIERAQRELIAEDPQPEAINLEVAALFARYPGALPDEIFHEICFLGD